jgi:hypothetical protein
VGVVCRALLLFDEVYIQWMDLMEPIKKATKVYYIQYCFVRLGNNQILVAQAVPQQVPFGGLCTSELIEIARLVRAKYEELKARYLL